MWREKIGGQHLTSVHIRVCSNKVNGVILQDSAHVVNWTIGQEELRYWLPVAPEKNARAVIKGTYLFTHMGRSGLIMNDI